MNNVLYLANDKYSAELSQQYNPGDTTIYVTFPPDKVPTLLVAGRGTANETVFEVLNKTLSSVNEVRRISGANVVLLIQTPITCLNNAEFINQYRSYLGLSLRGEWDNATDYLKYDSVSYLGATYLALQDGTNHLPTDTDYWQVMSAKGDTGSQGIQGIQGLPGNDGADGLGVPAGGATGEVLTKKSGSDNDTEWKKGGSGDFLVTQVFS